MHSPREPHSLARMSVPTPAWEAVEGGELIPPPTGLQDRDWRTDHPNGTGATLPLPAPSWRFARHDDADRINGTPEFQREDPESWGLASAAQIEHGLDAAALAYERAQERLEAAAGTPDEPYLRGEVEFFKKITIQRGRSPFWFVGEEGPGEGPTLPALLYEIADKVLAAYRAHWTRTEFEAAFPIDTNAGWPTFSPGVAPKLCGAALSANTLPALLERLHGFAVRTGIPECTIGAFAYSTRQGPLAKPVDWFTHVGGGTWMQTGTATSLLPRTRKVKMDSQAKQESGVDLLLDIKSARSHLLGSWHDKQGALLQRARLFDFARDPRAHIFEADISGYDDSVHVAYQDMIVAAIKKHFPHLSSAVDIWIWGERRPVAGPSVDGSPGFTIRAVRGGTRSGSKFTAEVGTLGATIGTLYVATLLRLWDVTDVVAAWSRGEIPFSVQGDDVLLATTRSFDLDEWKAGWESFGFKCEAIPARRFLGRHWAPDRTYPVGGRIVQNTLSGENEARGEAELPLAVLGLAERWGDGPHSSIADLVVDCLKTSRLSIEMGIHDGPSARAWLATPDGKDRLTRALAKAAGTPWFRRLERDAPFSPGAAAMLAHVLAEARARGLDPLAASAATRARYRNCVHRLRRLPLERALALSISLFNAIQAGAVNDEDALALAEKA